MIKPFYVGHKFIEDEKNEIGILQRTYD